MALSQKHRSSIYQQLTPILGEEEAEALLSQFPARDLDEPVTKEFVRAEIALLRAELLGEIGSLRTEMVGLRGETMGEIGSLRAEMVGLRGETMGEIGRLRAEMLEKFREQTMWMAGSMTVGMGLAAGIATLLG